ncbi:hypothetical protein [Novosphingobium sp. B1]|uniref:hypothetical protein n=1 Tax=Novosphingobium sp. B1 TaxID=1938756 RepID=UPI0009D89B34|nr:hypothetical protein [Novosphingobium sp. B1]SMD07382.1 hypothetical protein SAMN06272759_13413 [Novosphingobium sp. B1]
MDTEDGVIWVYGTEDRELVITLSNDGIDCLRDIIAEDLYASDSGRWAIRIAALERQSRNASKPS